MGPTIILLLSCLHLLPVARSSIWMKTWGTETNQAECPTTSQMTSTYSNGIIKPYTYCTPKGNSPVTLTIPLQGLQTSCEMCRTRRGQATTTGTAYNTDVWYIGTPINGWESKKTPYTSGWNEVFWMTDRDTNWGLSQTAQQYKKVITKMTGNRTHIILTAATDQSPGCLEMALCPHTTGPDPYFPVRYCILPPKARPEVTGGNAEMPERERHILPVAQDSTNVEDTDHIFGHSWTDHSHGDDNPHPLAANVWWRYANMTASKNNVSGCYVCSLLPHATSQPHLFATPLSFNRGQEALTASQGNDTAHYKILSAINQTGELGLRATLEDSHLVNCDKGDNNTSCFPLCVNLTGSRPLPSVDTTHCNSTVHLGPHNVSSVDGIWWMCGWRVYFTLPVNVSTVCTPVTLSDHTYIISKTAMTSSPAHGRKRFVTFEPHDPIWGSNVPWEHRYWSTGDRTIHALFPNVGVGKIALRLETVDYRFQTFVNASITVDEAQQREVSALRMMALQTRMAVDLALAPQGGVCAIIRDHCCTYIPNENETILDALATMKNLRDTMTEESGTQSGWMDWLLSGSWTQIMLKVLVPVLVVILVFLLLCCFCSCCVVPMTKRLIQKVFIAQMYHYNLVQCDDYPPADDDCKV